MKFVNIIVATIVLSNFGFSSSEIDSAHEAEDQSSKNSVNSSPASVAVNHEKLIDAIDELTISPALPTSAASQVNPYREQANQLLPMKTEYFTFDEVWAAISPHLFKEGNNEGYFQYSLQMMFNELPLQKQTSVYEVFSTVKNFFRYFVSQEHPNTSNTVYAYPQLRFEQPIHPSYVVNGGWQCLLGKILKAKEDVRNGETEQKEALDSLLALHKKPFMKISNQYKETSSWNLWVYNMVFKPFFESEKNATTAAVLKEVSSTVDSAFMCDVCVRTAKSGFDLA